MTPVGKNTISGELLAGYVERVEAIRAAKADLAADEAQVMAEAKASGLVPAGIRMAVKLRAMKPAQREEAEAIRDQYMHALGHDAELPLFRQIGLIDVDIASRESVIAALKAFVPQNGAITIEAGGKPVRLVRDKDGEVSAAEVTPKPSPQPASATLPSKPKRAVPEVDGDGAEALGADGYRANEPIIANPFPFGDERRPRWDAGWRRASGTDGMGPSGG